MSVSSRLPEPGILFLQALASEVTSADFVPSAQSLRQSFPGAKAAFVIPQEALADLPALRRVKDALASIEFDLAIGDYVPSQARSRALQTLAPRFVIFPAAQIRDARASSPKKERLETAVEDLHDSEIQVIASGISGMEDQVMCAHLGFDFAQGSLFGKLSPRLS
jgi:EAL domain-containing protein (putative c-di-GMP-specific phosphodiesterase class I)